jgi:hypothetical protein
MKNGLYPDLEKEKNQFSVVLQLDNSLQNQVLMAQKIIDFDVYILENIQPNQHLKT